MTIGTSAAAVAHRLLFDALVEMRAEAFAQKNSAVFHLADLFHTFALDLRAAAEGELGYDVVLRRLEEQAAEKGCGSWLTAAVARAETNGANSLPTAAL